MRGASFPVVHQTVAYVSPFISIQQPRSLIYTLATVIGKFSFMGGRVILQLLQLAL